MFEYNFNHKVSLTSSSSLSSKSVGREEKRRLGRLKMSSVGSSSVFPNRSPSPRKYQMTKNCIVLYFLIYIALLKKQWLFSSTPSVRTLRVEKGFDEGKISM